MASPVFDIGYGPPAQPPPQLPEQSQAESFAQMLRRLAAEQGWSEDFQRFSDPEIDAWKQYWDPSRQRFRGGMYGGQEGHFYEKPTECPPGTTLHGSSCVPHDDPAVQALWGGGGAQGTAPAAQAVPDWMKELQGFLQTQSPLAQMLANQGGLFSQFDKYPGNGAPGLQGGAMAGGSVWWKPELNQSPAEPKGVMIGGGGAAGGGRSMPGAPRTATPPQSTLDPISAPQRTMMGQPRSPVPAGPVTNQSPLVGALAPLQSQGVPFQSGLSSLMTRQNKRPGAWF
jgi:hypothetical protein